MEAYFNSSLEHLYAELQRIDKLIKLHVLQFSQQKKHDNQYPGLQITSNEAEKLLNEPIGTPRWFVTEPSFTEQYEQLNELRQRLSQTAIHSVQQGVHLRLVHLAQLFALTEAEVDILLICLAIEFDSRYQTLYAYLQDDINKKRPTVELITNLLSTNLSEKLELRTLFDHSASLLKYKLIDIIENSGVALLSQAVKIDLRIANYLLEQNGISAALSEIASLIQPTTRLVELLLPNELKQRLKKFIQIDNIQQAIILLQGKAGAGKQTIAEAICAESKLPLLIIDVAQLVASKHEDNVILLVREARLQNAALFWKNAELLLELDRQQWLKRMLKQLEQHDELIFISSEKEWHWQHAIDCKWFISIKLPELTATERTQLWQQALPEINQSALTEIAQRFKLTPRQIFAAANTAIQLSRWRDPEQAEITIDHLSEACRLQANHQLGTLAKLLNPFYKRNDIILPPHCQKQLDEIINYVKNYDKVYEEWGFNTKIASNKGLNVLFSGPPGTGKTMAAEVIASSLQLDIYKIDLSAMVSKYIGETEKNLNRIFSEAESSNAILFFDEADALFGKRSEVQDAHDRYANIETSYLLQKIEEYSGIVILATNFKRNMDEAFMRRLHFCVDFTLPSVKERLQIWQKIWPNKLPFNLGINFDKLAEDYQITGGNIKNIVLIAMFKAAEQLNIENKIQLSTQSLIEATHQELKKMGKMLHENYL